MTSSDERVEIAARLRKAHGIMAFVDALGIDLDSDWAWTDVSKRVAELIDPTCEMTDASWDNGECTWGCICSACGAHIEHEKGRFLDYCPNCGARVVSGNDC